MNELFMACLFAGQVVVFDPDSYVVYDGGLEGEDVFGRSYMIEREDLDKRCHPVGLFHVSVLLDAQHRGWQCEFIQNTGNEEDPKFIYCGPGA